MIRTGTCASSGYTEYGPAPKCPGGEPLYISSVFFFGPVLAVVGWFMARAWGVLWPALCVSLGVGIATISLDHTVARDGRAFAI